MTLDRKFICNAYTKLESFFSSILFAVGLIVLFGFIFSMMFTSCAHKSGKKDLTREMATESLRLKVDRPESLKILGYSEPDSIFGKSFFTEDELMQISSALMDFQSDVIGDGGLESLRYDDPKQMSKIQRMSSSSALLENLFDYGRGDKSGDFSGWKMKVLYEAKDTFDQPIKGEHYFIFDKERKYILHSFDIPIL